MPRPVSGETLAFFLVLSSLKGILNNPVGIACDNAGNVYIAGKDNHRIRKISPLCTPPALSITASFTLFCYNAMPTFTATISSGVNSPAY